MSDDLDRESNIMPWCLGCPYHKIQDNTCKKGKCKKGDDKDEEERC